MNNNRNKDLMVVFNERWKANHSDDVKNAKLAAQKFNDKMYGKRVVNTVMTNQEKLNNMQKNMDATFRNNRNNF